MIHKRLNRKKTNPATAIFTGKQIMDRVHIHLFQYNEKDCFENSLLNEPDFEGFDNDHNRFWLHIKGIHDTGTIKNICNKLHVHNLVIQDILDVNQRPKFQEFEDYWFFTIKSFVPTDGESIEQEQLSFILGKNYLVSFQERNAAYFNHIRDRLRNNTGIVRERGTDFLLYLLLESILDNYFITLSQIEKNINEISNLDLSSDPSPEIISTIEKRKKQLHHIKKAILPIKEFIGKIERENFNFIHEKHIKYYFELKDLCLTLLDECDQMELILESKTNLFFSIQGHRMNQVMKTLTIVATIFIPLTFIAGIYGMNFLNMPELSWRWGYPLVWIIMLAMALIMLIYFRKKKWF